MGQIATEMGDPKVAPKIEFPSLPFIGDETVEEEPEVLPTGSVTREELEGRQDDTVQAYCILSSIGERDRRLRT